MFGSQQWMYSSGEPAYEIDGSLRFDSASSPYLYWTPSSASTSSRTFTLSTWVKLGNLKTGTDSFIWSGQNVSGTKNCELTFKTYSGEYIFQVEHYGSVTQFAGSVQRDPAAWYHLVAVWDTTQESSENRIKLYVNGQKLTSSNHSYPSKDLDFDIGDGHTQMIGALNIGGSGQRHFDGYIADMHFVDGQALTPDYFGEIDKTYGHWKPKEVDISTTPKESYGTNGFYLPFTTNTEGVFGDLSYTTADIWGDGSDVRTYLFEGNATDASGNSNGSLSGSYSYGQGILGQGINFAGGEMDISLGNMSSGFSHSVWIKTTANSTLALTRYYYNFAGEATQIRYDGKAMATYGSGAGWGTTYQILSDRVLTDGDWHHLCHTFDGTDAAFYVDGSNVGTASISGSAPAPTSGTLRMNGDIETGATSQTCSIDQCRIFNRALTEAEVLKLAGGYALDQTGNGNDWQGKDITVTDVVKDSPTNNFATLNSIDNGGATLQQGNLRWDSGSNQGTRSTFFMSSGKWYWEFMSNESNLIGEHGVAPSSKSLTGTIAYPGSTSGGWGFSNSSGNKVFNNTFTNITSGGSNGDVIMTAVDMDAGKIWWGRNGTWLGSGNPASGTNQAFSGLSGDLSPMTGVGGAAAGAVIYNFGQDSSFAGNKTAQGNTDSDGVGDFYYTPPSGYLALCTKNLPDPAVVPSKQFNTVLYAGNGSTQSITGIGFSPNLVWIRRRNIATNYNIFDTNRGANKKLYPNLSNSEYTDTNALTSFDSDGFSLGADGEGGSASGSNYVAWNWNASGSTSSNTNGTGITSTVDVNSDAGFSIATYSGTGSSGSTVGHGLSQAPEFVVIKQRNGTGHFGAWHKDLGTGKNIALSSNSRAFTVSSETTNGGISTANSSVVSFQSGTSDVANVNVYDGTYVMYSWHSVDGFSKVGSYTGNGSTDGTFVHTGFRPAFILVKNTIDNDNWYLHDTARDPVNPTDNFLEPNVTGVEGDGSANAIEFDILSNGFKCVDTANQINGNGDTYIYLAFAEYPFKYSNARGASFDKYVAPAQDYTIDQSLRFNDNDSAYLSRTPSSAGNRRTFTYSTWIKRGTNGGRQNLFGAGSGYIQTKILALEGTDNSQISLNLYTGSNYFITSNQLLRDMSAWYHIVVAVDTTQSTASNRVKVYLNGEQVTSFQDENYPPQNGDTQINNSNGHYIGQTNESGYNFYYDGYMAETHFIDGQALGPEHFGTTDETYGNWIPTTYGDGNPEDDYGSNGFYLDFQSGAIGTDRSGKGNNWTASNLANSDVVLDSPTNNFATFNALANNHSDGLTLSEGNLKHYLNRSSYTSTFGITTGKWYWEFNAVVGNSFLGLYTDTSIRANQNVNTVFDLFSNGEVTAQNATLVSDYLSSISAGDIISFALDATNGTCDVYQNNTKVIEISNIPTTNSLFFFSDRYSATGLGYPVVNFGQDSSFAGNKTAQGNTDSNSIGDFYYTPPSGFLALCTANLSDPAVVPSEHFNTVLYSGNNATPRTISGVGFQPEFVWVKNRGSASYGHYLWDVVRGTDKNLRSDGNYSESAVSAASNGIISTNASNGFVTKAGSAGSNNVNGTGGSYVAWNWKANGSGVSNTNGSITSTVSANQDAGFSIVSYTGNGSSGATIGHGLSSAPQVIIPKNRDSGTQYWKCYFESLGATKNLSLSENAGAYTDSSIWNNTAPTSSVFTVGNGGATNQNGANQLAYCFHSVDGFSKVGSYTGNGSSDGTFVYTGFRPQWVMVKNVDGVSDWHIKDTKRDTYNPTDKRLQANLSDAESGGYDQWDSLSNGFKMRSSHSTNYNGSTYVYIAFAENPFKHSNAR